jgi:116 kDa U5 small nuclear ribonucleoprotein component
VLHEDKKYYPDAEEVYKGVETLVEDEDTQAINQPIIGTEKQKEFDLVERKTPETRFDYEFMKFIMETPELIRNVKIISPFFQNLATVACPEHIVIL